MDSGTHWLCADHYRWCDRKKCSGTERRGHEQMEQDLYMSVFCVAESPGFYTGVEDQVAEDQQDSRQDYKSLSTSQLVTFPNEPQNARLRNPRICEPRNLDFS
jgi:hypothetical protein